METVTLSKARASLGYYAKRALAGEEIGVVVGSQILLLRPTSVTQADYALDEYGWTQDEVSQLSKNVKTQVTDEENEGELTSLTDLLKNGNSLSKSRARGARRAFRR